MTTKGLRTVPALVRKLTAWDGDCDGERPPLARDQTPREGLTSSTAICPPADAGTASVLQGFDRQEDKDMDTPTPVTGIKRRGFASLSPERRTEIAKLGGQSVPEEKRSFTQNRELAREAGRKGGIRSSHKRRDA